MARIHDVIEGLQILARYTDPEAHEMAAEHDIIYAGPEGVEVSEEDAKRLDELGWHFEERISSWARFV